MSWEGECMHTLPALELQNLIDRESNDYLLNGMCIIFIANGIAL